MREQELERAGWRAGQEGAGATVLWKKAGLGWAAAGSRHRRVLPVHWI